MSLSLLFALLACDTSSELESPASSDTASDPCAWDDDSVDAPAALGSEPVPGWICPLGDQDWYRVELQESDALLTLSLELEGPVSPLDLSWTVWDSEGTEVQAEPESHEAATTGQPLEITHGLAPGVYLVALRDVGADAYDTRHGYRLTATASPDPDPNEPNQDASTATAGGQHTGYVAYRGDEDWFVVRPEQDAVLSLALDADVVDYQLAYSLRDGEGETIGHVDVSESTRLATSSSLSWAIGGGERWYAVVSDDDGLDADRDTPYQLTLELLDQPDALEPNDDPAASTGLGALRCAETWSDPVEAQGYLATPADVDWFRVDLSRCESGVLEASLQLGGEEGLPEGLSPMLRFLRPDPESSCSVDQDCQSLSRTCSSDWDCAGYGNTCLGDGVCAGSGSCLPSGSCGATLLYEQAVEDRPGTVEVAVPTLGEESLYLEVSDFMNDSASLEDAYTLTVRARQDPDEHEPNHVWTAGPGDAPSYSVQTPYAVTVPVHDCSVPTCCLDLPVEEGDSGSVQLGGDTAVEDCCGDGTDACCLPTDCCGEDDWIEGQLSFSYDQDWYAYEHPCPDEDCLLQVHFEVGEGPVDVYTQLLVSNSLWFDALVDVSEESFHAPISSAYGGLEADDECFYAYSGHGSSTYHLGFRDTNYGGESERWDWDPDQTYRFCIEKVSQECVPPCTTYDDGCGQP